MLEVVDPGPLLVVEDRGRPGFAHLGVPPSGACDSWALAAANVLAGGPPDAAVLEITLGGTELRVVETCVVSIAGADLGAERDDGRALPPGAAYRLSAGSRLRFAGGRRGMRAYLALAGGLVADRVLGSASTWAPGASQGVLGRALVAGDRIEPRLRGDLAAGGRTWPASLAPNPAAGHGPIRFIPGPDLRHLPPDAVAAFVATGWRASSAIDRMGIRLNGDSLAAGLEALSHPLVPGSIQVPGDGRPVVLLVDGPTIGGYPVLGVVTRAELARLAQVRPGDGLDFSAQEPGAARDAWRDQHRQLEAAAAALGADDVWARLPDNAGG